jgi:hypothetical protein
MHTLPITRTLSNGITETKIVSYQLEHEKISVLFNNLINNDVKEILKQRNDDLFRFFFPEDSVPKNFLSIIISYDDYKYHRPTILFNGSDFPEEKEIIKEIKTKVNECQSKLDVIWNDFLNQHNITYSFFETF